MRLKSDLRCERLGDELVVLDSSKSVVHRLHGQAARYVQSLLDAPGSELPDDVVTSGLISAGIVEETGISRRRVVMTAATLATVGVVTLALPSAVAAASTFQDPSYPSETESYQQPVINAQLIGDKPYVSVTWERNVYAGPSLAKVTFNGTLTGDGANGGPITIPSSVGTYTSGDLSSTWITGEQIVVSVTATNPANYGAPGGITVAATLNYPT